MMEYNYAFATDTLVGPKISMMVTVDSIHGSIFAVVARTECVQWTIFDVANALIKRCQSTAVIMTATPKGSKGSLGRGERANLIIQGQLRAFREAVSMKYRQKLDRITC